MPKAPPGRPNLNLDDTKKALESGDAERVLAALDAIELSSDRKAAPLVDALLTRGRKQQNLVACVGRRRRPGSGSLERSGCPLRQTSRGRGAPSGRAKSRSHEGFGRRASPAPGTAQQRPGATRRGPADGLGALNAKDAVPDLFVVLPKETPRAAGAIGALCGGDECKKFVTLLGRLPFDVMESGFLPLLLRAGPEVPDGVKLQLIEQLRRMATPKANELLESALAAYPAKGSPQIKAAIDAALHGHSVSGEAP